MQQSTFFIKAKRSQIAGKSYASVVSEDLPNSPTTKEGKTLTPEEFVEFRGARKTQDIQIETYSSEGLILIDKFTFVSS